MRSNAVGSIRYLLSGSVDGTTGEPRGALSLEKDLSTEKTSRFRAFFFFFNPFLFRTTHEERDNYIRYSAIEGEGDLIDSIVGGDEGREGGRRREQGKGRAVDGHRVRA